MPNIWMTSDPHFGHEFVAHKRGFPTAADHDRALERTWNKQVQPDDDVWVLGDVALGGWMDRMPFIADLPGCKHLVLGNHDRAHPIHRNSHNHLIDFLFADGRIVFATVQTAANISLGDGVRVHASHFPYYGDRGPDRFGEWRLRDEGRPLVHGHTHGTERLTRTDKGTIQVHVGLDAWDLRLVHRTEIVDLIQRARKNPSLGEDSHVTT